MLQSEQFRGHSLLVNNFSSVGEKVSAFLAYGTVDKFIEITREKFTFQKMLQLLDLGILQYINHIY